VRQTGQVARSQDVYLELGRKRTFAGALQWPGWCRAAKDEPSALEALVAYAPRYRAAIGDGFAFEAPQGPGALTIVERLEGNATTDFGGLAIAPAADAAPLDATDLARLSALLHAVWATFDRAVARAGETPLRTGPRGGGRQIKALMTHVQDAESAYLRKLGRTDRWPMEAAHASTGGAAEQRQAVLLTLGAIGRGELPPPRPRGGALWTPRYFIRRTAWHVLDHAWEIEDRLPS
jgi:hypothetical protein